MSAKRKRRRRSEPGRTGLPIATLLTIVLVAAAVVASVAFAAEEEPATEPSGPVPVLGSKSFAKPYGAGFGLPEPEAIFNGGDPSGEVSKIHWTDWGETTATGYGLNAIFRPQGGYYRKRARVELRATDLGKCGKQVAYTRLEVRIPKHPGGKLGKWFSWSGAKTLCKPAF
jgi:hypothetical protein